MLAGHALEEHGINTEEAPAINPWGRPIGFIGEQMHRNIPPAVGAMLAN